MSDGKIEGKRFEKYDMFLAEPHRPPSKGGNTTALHAHVLTIEGERYSFHALGSQQWAYKTDSISFQFEVKDGYKNILKDTFAAFTKNGEPIVRGNRGFKSKLRTASSRMPASRREQRD